MPAPRPILKGLPSSLVSSETTASNPLPFSSCPTIFDSPHVHFPPTPTLTSTEITHSSFIYDRAPIVVTPNICALPERGGRMFIGSNNNNNNSNNNNNNQGALGYFHPQAKFQVNAVRVVELDSVETVSPTIFSASVVTATVGNVVVNNNECGGSMELLNMKKKKKKKTRSGGPIYEYDYEYDRYYSSHDHHHHHQQQQHNTQQHAEHVVLSSSLLFDHSSDSSDLGVFYTPPPPRIPTPSPSSTSTSSSSSSSSMLHSSLSIPPRNVYNNTSSSSSPSPTTTTAAAGSNHQDKKETSADIGGKKRWKNRMEGLECRTIKRTKLTTTHGVSDSYVSPSADLELEGCLGGF